MVTIRAATVADAARLLELRYRLDRETAFMMLEPGERTTTEAQMAERLQSGAATGDVHTLVAEDGNELVGYLAAERGAFRRNRHSAYLTIGIRQSHVGQGIGARLFGALEEWARESGVHRLELTVMTHNDRGVALYQKAGFAVEGVRRHSLQVDGRYVDEYGMAKLLD